MRVTVRRFPSRSGHDRGGGYVLGLGPRYAPSPQWAVALNLNCYASTSDNRFTPLTASLDYPLR